ncbi:MAG: response regulator [Verrucomicrobia bacterium]|nr:response regulator [Verrucomicrobiota bacterium]
MPRDPTALLPPRLLVVDDERQIHASLRLRLAGGYELEASLDARDALEKIRRQRFDLCLADIHLPRMDGLTFIDEAKEIDPDLGFVVLSAFDSAENLRRAIPLNIFEFIAKPLPDKAVFEDRIPGWVDRTRQRRRDRMLAQTADQIAADRDTARLEREVELIASETARDVLRQSASLLTTVHAHLAAATTFLAGRARGDSGAQHLLRGLEQARIAAEAAMTTTEVFFDSAYANRDASPALPGEGIRQAVDIALRFSRTGGQNKTVDFHPPENNLPIRGLSGIDFLLMMIPALCAAIDTAPPDSTIGVHCDTIQRLDSATRESPPRREVLWVNRKHASGGQPALLIRIRTAGSPLAGTEFEEWLAGLHEPLARVPARGLVQGIQRCHGLLGVHVLPHAERFGFTLVLPT